MVVPGRYSDSELAYQARNVAGMATHNASFDCTSAKLLLLSRDWPQREAFLAKLAAEFDQVSPRRAYYPGAADRWKSMTENRSQVQLFGKARDGELPWALIRGVDASAKDDRSFRQEPWCAVLSETSLPGGDASTFLSHAVPFVNDHVWGTLCASLIVPGGVAPSVLEPAIDKLRYGTVSINTWSSVGFAVGVTPWGGHPSSTPQDIQSGHGFVHNTFMLGGIEKVVLRAPLKMFPVPPWFPNVRSLTALGKRLADSEYEPSWLKVPGIVAAALRG